MNTPEQDARLAQWQAEAEQPFTGWDFSYLHGRMREEPLPWDYLARAGALMAQADAVLDLETGGGEKLLSLRDHWPRKVAVTEEYPPNVILARQRLQPLGVTVMATASDLNAPLPFAAGEFDLVINRHGAWNSAEVARILTPGGAFLTQQVDGNFADDLLAHFAAKPQWPFATMAFFGDKLTEAGLELVTQAEYAGPLHLTDVGALVYYLKAVPWHVPDFSVEKYAATLLALHQQAVEQEGLTFTARYYMIEARKAG